MNNTVVAPNEDLAIDLKDNLLAAFLAWLLPGLGHWYQGRRAKAALFFVMIMGVYVFGLYLGSDRELGWARVVYASWREDRDAFGNVRDDDKRLHYLGQIGIGLPALPALVQAIRMRNDKAPWFHGFMAPPRLDSDARAVFADQPTVSQLHSRLHRFFELGTVYTMVAGLLNIMAIYDAWGGPVFLAPVKKEEDEEPPTEPDRDDAAKGA